MNHLEMQNALKTIFNNIKLPESQDIYRNILSFIDLTTLEGKDTNDTIHKLCKKAYNYENKGKNIKNVAAVCVYPTLVKLAKKSLLKKNINVAAVAGAFPSGQSPLHIRIEEVKYAVGEGADEIDMVISRGKFLEGDFDYVFEEISKIKEACSKTHLKVILETGELESAENIYKASNIAIDAGADFIKTSTGKIQPAATLEASYIMLKAIKEHYDKTGKMIGFKPAGGISEPKDALKYYHLVNIILGKSWLTKHYFRFGASRLADKILAKLI
ncbi:MAG: deoxyribose-phosphate aldolase [Bacteroidetes bacterium HGW-Bacteroidetes-15]|nr:MAG: deoxyribose-phosphate aldolase [Bacteroidetes bacterium HGW-Bacteroidetes-15]